MGSGRFILLGLLGLVVAEAALFLMAGRILGSFGALFTLFATSILGCLVLARMGRRLAGRLADMLARRDTAFTQVPSNGVLTVLGGLLLLIPGFITDIAGLLLLMPAVQAKLIDRPLRKRSRPGGEVLELDRSQWRDLPEKHIQGDRDRKDRR
jgi:UPF0716 protein FxsA